MPQQIGAYAASTPYPDFAVYSASDTVSSAQGVFTVIDTGGMSLSPGTWLVWGFAVGASVANTGISMTLYNQTAAAVIADSAGPDGQQSPSGGVSLYPAGLYAFAPLSVASTIEVRMRLTTAPVQGNAVRFSGSANHPGSETYRRMLGLKLGP